jgi:hypothetical protein
MLFGSANGGTGATKEVTWCKIFSETVNIKIFIKKDYYFFFKKVLEKVPVPALQPRRRPPRPLLPAAPKKSRDPGSWPRTCPGAEGRALACLGHRGRGAAEAPAPEPPTRAVVAWATLARCEVAEAATPAPWWPRPLRRALTPGCTHVCQGTGTMASSGQRLLAVTVDGTERDDGGSIGLASRWSKTATKPI